MTVITEYFTKAELALTAYAKLTPGISGKDYTDALEDSSIGMSAIQAQNFASNWRVIAQYDGKAEETYIDEFGQEHVIFNPTGVSATVFENVADGKCHLAIRGTNDPNDIVTDFIDILVLGTPERQDKK